MKALVIIPTYNERENIERLCRAILQAEPRADVLVVDDNSPDGTGEIADRLAEETGRVQVVHRPGKLGLGSAEIAGLRRAMERGCRCGITMDADFSHPPDRLPALIDAAEQYDVVIGSRYIPGGAVEGWPWRRKILSAGVNLLARTMLRLKPKDCSGGFRCYRTDAMARLGLDRIDARGYNFQEEMLWLCQRSGLSIGEVPITFVDRREGTSKVSFWEIFRTFWTLVRLMFSRPNRHGARAGDSQTQ